MNDPFPTCRPTDIGIRVFVSTMVYACIGLQCLNYSMVIRL